MVEKIKVIITDKQKKVKIPTGTRMLVRRTCNAVLRMEDEKPPVEVSVTFVDDEQIRDLNKRHRGIDEVTDVLSFPLGERGNYDINPETGAKMLGDIVLSLERTVEQAERFEHSFQRELAYLTAHSVLHLLGYDHEEGIEGVRMREKEETVMSLLGLPRSRSYVMEDE